MAIVVSRAYKSVRSILQARNTTFGLPWRNVPEIRITISGRLILHLRAHKQVPLPTLT